MRFLPLLAFSLILMLEVSAQDRHPLIIGGLPLSTATNGELIAFTGTGTATRIKIFPNNPDGNGSSYPFTNGSDGKVYGVVTGGLQFGMLFRCEPDGTGYQIIHTFPSVEGNAPLSNLMQLDGGKLQGIMRAGGGGLRTYRINNDGSGFEPQVQMPFSTTARISLLNTSAGVFGITTYATPQKAIIFKISLDGTVSTVVEFATGAANGNLILPYLLHASNGHLYGSATSGGTNNKGTIFRVKTDGTDFGVVRHLAGTTDGTSPTSNLLEIQGSLYLVAGLGIYKYALNGSSPSLVVSTGGSSTTLLLHTSNDKILFVTSSFDNGVTRRVHQVDVNGANSTLIKEFRVDSPGDFQPLLDAGNGNYIGTAGSLFRIRTDGDLSIIKQFRNIEGTFPNAQLLLHPDGFLYGVTAGGGAVYSGVVYKIKQDGTGFAVVKDLPGIDMTASTGTLNPVMLASNGFLYGTIVDGGASLAGIIYRLKPDGSEFQVLHEFDMAMDGSGPSGKLVEINQQLYGTASFNGGVGSAGTLYRIDLDGNNFTKLYGFVGNPENGVAELQANVLYGNTRVGGANNVGYLYKFDLSGGGFTKLYDYSSTAQRAIASNPIVKDNVIYGLINSNATTAQTFRMNPDGSGFTILATVAGDGLARNPYVLASDGYIYWHTWGGTSLARSLFRSKLNSTTGELVYKFPDDPSTFIPFGLTAVDRTPQQITFSELAAKTLGDAPFTLNATTNAALEVSYTSSDPNTASISGNQVTLHKAGPVEITTTQNGDLLVEPAASVKRSFCINPIKPTITGSPVLTSSSDTGNQWYKDGSAIAGATNKTYTAETSGAYTVKTMVSTCSSEMSLPANVVVTGLYESPSQNVRVYPNPANQEINIELIDNANRAISISMIDGLGRTIEQRNSFTNRSERFVTASLPKGIFYFRINTTEKFLSYKFEKQ